MAGRLAHIYITQKIIKQTTRNIILPSIKSIARCRHRLLVVYFLVHIGSLNTALLHYIVHIKINPTTAVRHVIDAERQTK